MNLLKCWTTEVNLDFWTEGGEKYFQRKRLCHFQFFSDLNGNHLLTIIINSLPPAPSLLGENFSIESGLSFGGLHTPEKETSRQVK